MKNASVTTSDKLNAKTLARMLSAEEMLNVHQGVIKPFVPAKMDITAILQMKKLVVGKSNVNPINSVHWINCATSTLAK